MVVYDSDFASQLRFLQQSYLADAMEVKPSRWQARGWRARLAQNAAAALGPVL
jgi:hypothetical protein